MGEQCDMQRLTGKVLSPGLGEGMAYIYKDSLQRHDEFYEIEAAQVKDELDRLKRARSRVADDLDQLAGKIDEEMGGDLSAVFRAHLAILQDPCLQQEMEKEVRYERISAGAAVRAVFRRWQQRFDQMEAEVARQKSDDLRDLSRRFISALAGVRGHALETIPEGSVLVAHRLLPSDTVYLARNKARAVVLEYGGVGSHAALFAREVGLPCMAGLDRAVERINPDTLVLVDAIDGEVIIHPSAAEVNAFEQKQQEAEQIRAAARSRAAEGAVTSEGKCVHVLANVSSVADTLSALNNGAEGIGLYRVEQVYFAHSRPPGLDELLQTLRKTLAPAANLPVTVRLLDAGADKSLPFMEEFSEQNPTLGQRGVRFLERYPDLAETQLDALVELAADFDLRILVPMVTLPRDLAWISSLLKQKAERAGLSTLPPVGAMIETPAAALASRALAPYADFLSFGTNDLTQYTFAADRENVAVDAYYDDTHDAIFRLISMVHSDLPDMPLSLCGELAGRPGQIERILQCGIETVSVGPPIIPYVKKAIREL